MFAIGKPLKNLRRWTHFLVSFRFDLIICILSEQQANSPAICKVCPTVNGHFNVSGKPLDVQVKTLRMRKC